MRSWLDSKKGLGQGRLLGSVLLAAALGSGCGTALDEEAPAAAASEALGTASDSTHFELEGLIAGLEGNLGRSPQEAFLCDPEPEVTETQVCDRTIPSVTRFEWSNCDLAALRPPPPPGAGQGQEGQRPPPPPPGTPPMGTGEPPPPPPGGMMGMMPGHGGHRGFDPGISSGTVELANDVSVEGTCGSSDVRFNSQQRATFSTTHTLSDGSVVVFQGTTTSTGAQSSSETISTRSGTLDTTREVRDAQGQMVRGLHLAGSVTVTFDRSGEQPTRTLNGTFDASFSDDTASTITVTDLVRAPPFVCRWPTSGTVRQVQQDGTEHVLSYGPECGTATLDGQPYELRRGPHGGEEGHGGPRPGGPGAPGGPGPYTGSH